MATLSTVRLFYQEEERRHLLGFHNVEDIHPLEDDPSVVEEEEADSLSEEEALHVGLSEDTLHLQYLAEREVILRHGLLRALQREKEVLLDLQAEVGLTVEVGPNPNKVFTRGKL